MKKLALLLLLLASPFLVADTARAASSTLTQGVMVWSESRILTRAAPSTSSTDGIALKNVVAFRIVVCAPSGQAITGGDIWFWVQTTDGLWADNPTLKKTLSSTAQRCQAVSGDLPVLVRSGRFIPTTNSVTLSGAGTTVTMKVEAQIL